VEDLAESKLEAIKQQVGFCLSSFNIRGLGGREEEDKVVGET